MFEPTFRISPVSNAHQQNELYIHLYLHRTYVGPNENQSIIQEPEHHNKFGWTLVNDWPLYDGVGPNAKVIAYAQGLHIQAGIRTRNWYNSFSIVFKDNRFSGSSLEVMGPVVENGEWAIVGGTGELLQAEGIIYKKFLEQQSVGDIIELNIHAFYTPHSNCWSLGM